VLTRSCARADSSGVGTRAGQVGPARVQLAAGGVPAQQRAARPRLLLRHNLRLFAPPVPVRSVGALPRTLEAPPSPLLPLYEQPTQDVFSRMQVLSRMRPRKSSVGWLRAQPGPAASRPLDYLQSYIRHHTYRRTHPPPSRRAPARTRIWSICAVSETCPVSTEGGTRHVQLVREGGGKGRRSARRRRPARAASPTAAPRRGRRRCTARSRARAQPSSRIP